MFPTHCDAISIISVLLWAPNNFASWSHFWKHFLTSSFLYSLQSHVSKMFPKFGILYLSVCLMFRVSFLKLIELSLSFKISVC